MAEWNPIADDFAARAAEGRANLWQNLADALNALEAADVALVYDYNDLDGPGFSGLDRHRVQWDEAAGRWVSITPVAPAKEQS